MLYKLLDIFIYKYMIKIIVQTRELYSAKIIYFYKDVVSCHIILG